MFTPRLSKCSAGKNRIALFSCTNRFLHCLYLRIPEYPLSDPTFMGSKINFLLDKKKKSEIWSNDFNLLNKHELNLEHKLFHQEKKIFVVPKYLFQPMNS